MGGEVFTTMCLRPVTQLYIYIYRYIMNICILCFVFCVFSAWGGSGLRHPATDCHNGCRTVRKYHGNLDWTITQYSIHTCEKLWMSHQGFMNDHVSTTEHLRGALPRDTVMEATVEPEAIVQCNPDMTKAVKYKQFRGFQGPPDSTSSNTAQKRVSEKETNPNKGTGARAQRQGMAQ